MRQRTGCWLLFIVNSGCATGSARCTSGDAGGGGLCFHISSEGTGCSISKFSFVLEKHACVVLAMMAGCSRDIASEVFLSAFIQSSKMGTKKTALHPLCDSQDPSCCTTKQPICTGEADISHSNHQAQSID